MDDFGADPGGDRCMKNKFSKLFLEDRLFAHAEMI